MGRIRNHKDHLQRQRQSPRDFEMYRRSHDTDSRFLQHKNRDTTSDRRGRFEEGNRMRHEVAQSRDNCRNYVKNGVCSYIGCRFNHPIHLRGTCRYFLRGACKNGSGCRFYHPMDRDGTMHQARSTDRRASGSSEIFDERRHERGSSSRPEKRARTIPDSRERYPRHGKSQRHDGTVAEVKRPRLEMQEKHVLDQQLSEEERQREIDRQREKSRRRLDRMKSTVKFDDSHVVKKTLQEFGFKRGEGDGL